MFSSSYISISILVCEQETVFDLAIEKQCLHPAVLQNATEKSVVVLRLDVLYCVAMYSTYSRRVLFGFLNGLWQVVCSLIYKWIWLKSSMKESIFKFEFEAVIY